MAGDHPDTQKNEDPIINLNSDAISSTEHRLLKSKNLLRQKNAQDKSVLCCGKWLQIVKNGPKVSCEVSTSASHFLSNMEDNHEAQSKIRSHQSKKVTCLSSKTLLSPPYTDGSQGTLQFTMTANGTTRFVFQLENQKDIYVANNIEDQSVYLIYLKKGDSSSNLVGKIRVSTFSSERIIEREFVLFSSNGQKISRRRKNRELSEKLVDAIKNNQSISNPWYEQFQFQEPSFENNLSSNLETLAVVVKQEFHNKGIGGWGLKFLKKSRLNDSTKTGTEASKALISMNVVIPSGVHGGPEDGPLSLIQRWKSQGNCDCGGWDLGCSLTLLKGQPQKDQFELSIEGSKSETPGLRIVTVRGLYLVQFENKLPALQSFSIALAFIHSHKLELC